MRFVPIKTAQQQDIQAVHRVRSLLMKERIAISNQIRGLLAEYGIVAPKLPTSVRKHMPRILEESGDDLSSLARSVFTDLYQRLVEVDAAIARYDQRVQQIFSSCSIFRKIEQVRGVGPLIATAIVAAAGDGKEFKRGRQFAAWLGLVPRQQSSGGKSRFVHKESISIAYAKGLGDVELSGKIGTTQTEIDRLCKRLQAKAMHIYVVYEAGPCGYGLYRHLVAKGLACMVCAPSLIPRKPGDRVKTDRRDAIKLVRSLRAGDLSAVHLPNIEDESFRDLARAWSAMCIRALSS
ncbi:hypothetical protein ASE07_26695 [Noviherbaspirillum sp. Root189]|nr:hypothetical protein ASE07_26695 [Noviherbaspirillum sp. Root189]